MVTCVAKQQDEKRELQICIITHDFVVEPHLLRNRMQYGLNSGLHVLSSPIMQSFATTKTITVEPQAPITLESS